MLLILIEILYYNKKWVDIGFFFFGKGRGIKLCVKYLFFFFMENYEIFKFVKYFSF